MIPKSERIDVSAYPGVDLGTQFQHAVDALEGGCATFSVPHGHYRWSTPLVKLPACVTVEGNGSVVMVDELSAPFLVIANAQRETTPTLVNASVLTPGGVNNITFQGPGPTLTSTIGIFYGGDPKGIFTPKGWLAYLTNFTNLHITGFGTGFEYGLGFQTAFFGGSVENNNVGFAFANDITGIENINMHGIQILNNLQQGFYANETGVYVEWNCTDCSIDYNGQNYPPGANMTFKSGLANIVGGHFEGPMLPFVRIASPDAPTTVNVHFEGVGWNLVDSNKAHAYKAFIEDKALNSRLFIGKNNSFGSAGAKVDSVAWFEPLPRGQTGFFSDIYSGSQGSPAAPLTAFSGKQPDSFSYPSFNSSGLPKSMVNSYEVGAAAITAPQVTGTLYAPQQGTKAPLGKCVSAGTLAITADGHATYCKAGTLIWTTLY